MKANFFYNKQPITKFEFLLNVESDWIKKIDSIGYYSFGYYHCQILELDGIKY